MIHTQPFDRQKHVYRNDDFAELVKDAVRFFNGTPVFPLPPSRTFHGVGVYSLYYTGRFHLYADYAKLNRLGYAAAIYVGKAVPEGWRQARTSDHSMSRTRKLYGRLTEHATSICRASNLSTQDFMCRFVIFEDESSDMIGSVEAALIKYYAPLWNSVVDGFGNHDPGKGRYEQARSDWDVLHPGRPRAEKCHGASRKQRDIREDIQQHFRTEKRSR